MVGVAAAATLFAAWVIGCDEVAAQPRRPTRGRLRVEVRDDGGDRRTDGEPVPANVILERRGVKQRIARGLAAGEWTAVPGGVTLNLRADDYRLLVDRGPEFRFFEATFTIDREGDDTQTARPVEIVDMSAEGWFAVDPSVAASDADPRLRAAAVGLDAVAVVDPVDGGTRDTGSAGTSGRAPAPPEGIELDLPKEWDRRSCVIDGPLIFHGLTAEDFVRGATPVQSLVANGLRDGVRVVIDDPFDPALPVWLASGMVDGVRVIDAAASGGGSRLRLPPRGVFEADPKLPDRWRTTIALQNLYFAILNAGIDLVPIAGSDPTEPEGVLGTPRTYATPDGGTTDGGTTSDGDATVEPERGGSERPRIRLSRESTNRPRVIPDFDGGAVWDAVWSGRTVATTGLLLRPDVEGRPPGATFNSAGPIELMPALRLDVRRPVEYLEIIQDGVVVRQTPLALGRDRIGNLPKLKFKRSGWAAIRVVGTDSERCDVALAAPWFVSIADQPRRPHPSAVATFRRWLAWFEEGVKGRPEATRRDYAPFIRATRRFWSRREAASEEE